MTVPLMGIIALLMLTSDLAQAHPPSPALQPLVGVILTLNLAALRGTTERRSVV